MCLPKFCKSLLKYQTFEERTLQKFINFLIKTGYKLRCYNFFIKFISTHFKVLIKNQFVLEPCMSYLARLLVYYKPVVRLRVRRKGSQLLQIPYLFKKKSGIIRYILTWFKEDLLLKSRRQSFFIRYKNALKSFLGFSKSIGYSKFLDYHKTAQLNKYLIFMLKKKKRRRNFRRT